MPDKSKKVVTTLALFRVGSRNEVDAQAGISHVLEHMHYKGTKKWPTPQSVSEFIENIGGEHNAFTGKEYTGYYTKVAHRHIAKSIEFISEIVVNPKLDADDLEREKNVIVQELDMYEDLPMEVAANNFEKVLFKKNPLGRDIIGTRESITNTSSADLFNYRKKFYTSSNCVIVIAGNIGSFSDDELLEMVESSFNLPEGKSPGVKAVTDSTGQSYCYVKKNIEQSHLVVGYPGSSYDSKDRFALRALILALGGTMSSRMFVEVREKLGLAYAIRSHSTSYTDTGVLETYAGVPHSRVEEAISVIIREYRKIKRSLDDSELARSKEVLYGRLLIGLEDTNEIANHFGVLELLTGQILTPDQIIEAYSKLTVKELIDCAERYFNDKLLTVSFVGKELTENKLKKLLG